MSEMKELTRENIIALNSKINEARSNEKFCDVIIQIGDKTFKCHRLILSSASEYFDGMFNSTFKESKSEVIELKEIEVVTFEDVLQFMYSGEVVVTESNVLNLICASEFYNLPGLRKFCRQFIVEKIEADVVIEDALEIFTFYRGTSAEDDILSKYLSGYIKKHLHYFLNSPSFLNITFDDLEEISLSLPVSKNENVIFQAIIQWLQQSSHSKKVEGALLWRLLDTVHFENISPEYIKCIIMNQCLNEEHNASKQNESDEKDDKKEEVSSAELLAKCEVNKISVPLPQSLYVYIKDIAENVTNVFSLQKCSMGMDWVFLCQANDSSESMRVASLNDRLYCLNYCKPLATSSPVQTFNISSSVSFFGKSSLKPPPLVVNQFDMCGMNTYLYMYNKDNFSNVIQSVEDSDFNDGVISRGIYAYNCEIDKWIPLPPMLQKLANASMTCDSEGGLIYLIGGKNPTQERLDGYVQAYDPRSGAWMAINRSNDSYEKGTCCCYNYDLNHYSKITVSGGLSQPKIPEYYIISAGKWWRYNKEMNSSANNHHLISHQMNIWAFGEKLTETSVEVYGYDSGWSWLSVPSLCKAARLCKSNNKKSSVSDVVMDCVTFKPFGL